MGNTNMVQNKNKSVKRTVERKQTSVSEGRAREYLIKDLFDKLFTFSHMELDGGLF